MVPDKYPAYIDRDTFAKIQAMLRDRALCRESPTIDRGADLAGSYEISRSG